MAFQAAYLCSHTEALCITGCHLHLRCASSVMGCRTQNPAYVRRADEVTVDNRDATDAEMRELKESDGAGSPHAYNCDMEATDCLLPCLTKSETLSIEP